MSSIAVNPFLTTNPGGLFDVDTNGFSQGFTWDNPSTYMYLEGGIFNPSATVQLIGGLPIVEIVASENGNGRGQTIEIATTNASITGFSTFDRNYAAVQPPGSGVPLVYPGGSAMYYRLGRGARLGLQVTSALAAALAGGSSIQQVSWNFTSNMLDVYNSTTGALPVKIVSGVNSNSKIVTYDSTNQTYSWTTGTAVVVLI